MRITKTNYEYIYNCSYLQSSKLKCTLKPEGIYYAMGSEWLDLGFFDHEKYNIELELDFKNICIIDDFYSFEKFVQKYTINLYKYINCIDWKAVSEDYDGIEIRNYHSLKYTLSMSSAYWSATWFYAWDVNGGCIFNLRAINNQIVRNCETFILPSQELVLY